jgi:hypothetical protein
MRMHHVVGATFVLFVATVGCVSSNGDTPDEVVSSLDIAFAKESLLVGTLDYGQTSADIAYVKSPLYRTMRFEGGADDVVTVNVQAGAGASPLVWILDEAMKPLAASVPAVGAASTKASVSVKLPPTGNTFFLAVRTAAQNASTLKVSLSAQLPVAGCDEDNLISREVVDSDRGMPHSVLSYIRASGWNCMHREWHDVRQLSFLIGAETAYIAKYHPTWVQVNPQEGEVGNGMAFLAMHRAMIGILRSRFAKNLDSPKYVPLKGWAWGKVPRDLDDPTSPVPGFTRRPFDDRYAKVISTFETSIAAFSSEAANVGTDDAFGLYVQTKRRPIPGTAWNLSRDLSTGIHNYLHGRFNDPQSAVRMGNFSRNLESQYFWQVHGWLDEAWSRFRKTHSPPDAMDAAYTQAMNVACTHMLHNHPGSHEGHTQYKWDVTASTCVHMK